MAAWFALERWGDVSVLLAIAADHLIVPQDVSRKMSMPPPPWRATDGSWHPADLSGDRLRLHRDRRRPEDRWRLRCPQVHGEAGPGDRRSYILDGAHDWNSGPWGSFTVLEEGAHHKIKRLSLKPGACISLRLHQHRQRALGGGRG